MPRCQGGLEDGRGSSLPVPVVVVTGPRGSLGEPSVACDVLLWPCSGLERGRGPAVGGLLVEGLLVWLGPVGE